MMSDGPSAGEQPEDQKGKCSSYDLISKLEWSKITFLFSQYFITVKKGANIVLKSFMNNISEVERETLILILSTVIHTKSNHNAIPLFIYKSMTELKDFF